jgi:plasmid maintenance system killer protein
MRFDGIAYFYGLIAPLPLALGALPLLRELLRRPWHVAALVVYPALFMLHAMNSGNEIRYMLPLLAPLIALHGARGLHWLLQALRAAGARRMLALLWLALALAVLALPPSFIKMKEGPRVLLGRAYTPPMWWRWQDATRIGMQRVDQLLQRIGAQPRTLVISAHWNDEFYLKLRLMEAGYADTAMAAAYPGCEGFTVYRDGRHEVLHLRLNNNWQLADMKQALFAALKLARSAQCPVIARQRQALLTTFGTEYSALDWKDYGLERVIFSSPMSMPVAVDWAQSLKARLLGVEARRCCVASVGLVAWALLDQSQLAQLFGHARQMLAEGAGIESGMQQYGVVRAASASRIERRHTE